METRLPNTELRDGEADRQMIVLALAHLAVERPGWLWTLRDLATTRFAAGELFDSFHQMHKEATPGSGPLVPPRLTG